MPKPYVAHGLSRSANKVEMKAHHSRTRFATRTEIAEALADLDDDKD